MSNLCVFKQTTANSAPGLYPAVTSMLSWTDTIQRCPQHTSTPDDDGQTANVVALPQSPKPSSPSPSPSSPVSQASRTVKLMRAPIRPTIFKRPQNLVGGLMPSGPALMQRYMSARPSLQSAG